MIAPNHEVADTPNPKPERIFYALSVLALLCLLVLAWNNRFILDDAFISFRYAKNFVEGKGLVWNEGERVEGYTNLLWTLFMSIPLNFGIDPIGFSYLLGLACLLASLVFTQRIAFLLLGSRWLSLFAMSVVGINHSFSAWATGGMETQMQACFTLGCLYWLMEAREAKKWPLIQIVSFSLLVSLSLLTRLDSVLLVGPTALGATLLLVRGPISTQQKIVKASILWLLIASVMLLWFAWKISYYGSVLPNTFYAKAAAPKNFKVGLYYLILFAMTYCLIPFGVLFLVSFKRFVKYMSVPLIALGTPILLWCVYVVWINGDFMEFRMMVPVIPLLVLFATFLTVNILPNGTGRYAFLVLLVVGSLAGYAYQGGWWIESVKDLRQQLIGKGKDWIRIGQTLGKIFLDKQGVTIATTAAGAIPYYSGLTTIDMFGLNDPWVAKQGRFIGPRPGHQRMATLEYLLQRQVNLVVSHPQVMPNDYCVRSVYSRCELINYLLVHPEDESKIPVDSVVLEIPMSDTHKLVVLYLVRSAEVEEVIRKQGWKWYPIDKGRCNCS